MVIFERALFFASKPWKPPRKYLRSKFIDLLKLHIIGGKGGTGLPKYGGLGGQGGCVYCVGKEGKNLVDIIKSYPHRSIYAPNGEDSKKIQLVGQPGADIMLEVPIGVTVYAENDKIGEINEEGATCIVARGGPGGNKNNKYLGYEGQNRNIVFELKLIADVGFVGFPNAGKSTLLKALSKAKPKIANYPFTTIRPNLGTLEFKDFRKITLADLPGLIEGAHINLGMGHKFLRHVERTKLILMLVDIQGFVLSTQHTYRTCFETILLLNKELELYDPELLNKPSILVINKMDTLNSEEKFQDVKYKLNNLKDVLKAVPPDMYPKQFLNFEEVIGISAAENGKDVNYLKDCIRSILDSIEDVEIDEKMKNIEDKLIEQGPQFT